MDVELLMQLKPKRFWTAQGTRLRKGEFSGKNLELIDNSKLLSSSGLDSQLDLSSAFCLSISVR